jgi:hypothetical protein
MELSKAKPDSQMKVMFTLVWPNNARFLAGASSPLATSFPYTTTQNLTLSLLTSPFSSGDPYWSLSMPPIRTQAVKDSRIPWAPKPSPRHNPAVQHFGGPKISKRARLPKSSQSESSPSRSSQSDSRPNVWFPSGGLQVDTDLVIVL